MTKRALRWQLRAVSRSLALGWLAIAATAWAQAPLETPPAAVAPGESAPADVVKNYTGVLRTYHPSGALSELLTLRSGQLDGLVERYDPQGHLIERAFFREGKVLTASDPQLGLGQRLGAPDSRPPLPPPASIAADGSTTAPIEIRGSGPPGRYLPRPPLKLIYEVGTNVPLAFGHSALGTFVEGSAMSQVYLLLALHRRLLAELDLAYLPNFSSGDRSASWPMLRSGLRLPLSSGASGLYLVGGAGVTWVNSGDVGSDPAVPVSDSAWYVGVDGGTGLSLQLSNILILTAEVRVGKNFRIDGGSHLMMPDSAGNLQELLGSYLFTSANIALGIRL